MTEADAHLGLANRLAAPFAERVFLALPVAGRDGAKYRAVGRPVPERSRAVPRAEARERLGLPADEPVVLVFGGSLGARAPERARASTRGADAGPAVLHLCGERDYESLRDASRGPATPAARSSTRSALAYGAADIVVARAGGSVWELAAAGLPAVLVPGEFATADHQRRTPSGSPTRAARSSSREADAARRVPELVAELLADPARLAAMAAAMRAAAKPDAAERIADELVALAPLAGRRIWIAGIGGAGMSAYALLAHAWGAEVAGWDRVETPYLAHLDGIEVDDLAGAAGAARRLGGLRLDRVRRSRRRPAARRPARRARLAAPLDRRRRRARQDDDERR